MLQPNWKDGTQNSVNDQGEWVVGKSQIVFRNPHIEVKEETVTVPGTQHPRPWTVVGRKKAVVIAPMTAEGRFVLIHQARIPIRKWLWEFPAGQVDETRNPSLDLLQQTAIRELAEEAGYELGQNGEWTYLGHYFPSQGFTDEENHLFLAKPVRKNEAGSKPDHAESISEDREFSLDELRTMIAESTIQDANTLVTFAMLAAKGLI
jgi:ADP-ribose pyrophosphatase